MSTSETFALIVPAAGGGRRTGRSIPKQYVEILGKPMLYHTLHRFNVFPNCIEILLPIDEQWRDKAVEAVKGIDRCTIVPGGKERQDSIGNALDCISSDPDLILVHDAARPGVSRALIERVIDGASSHGAAIPALSIPETVKKVDGDGVIQETLNREELKLAQTPQAFRAELLRLAYRNAHQRDIVGTDDASLVEALGERVVVVDGEPENIKVTYPEDFRRVEEILRDR